MRGALEEVDCRGPFLFDGFEGNGGVGTEAEHRLLPQCDVCPTLFPAPESYHQGSRCPAIARAAIAPSLPAGPRQSPVPRRLWPPVSHTSERQKPLGRARRSRHLWRAGNAISAAGHVVASYVLRPHACPSLMLVPPSCSLPRL